MIDFKEFLEEQSIQEVLNEAIRPKETSFGSNFPDLSNSRWETISYMGFRLTSTAFDGDDRWVVVDITSNNNLIFRTYPKVSAIKTFNDLAESARYDDKKLFRGNANAISIIKKVLYVGLSKLKNEQSFMFSSENPSLVKLYKAIVDSQPFKDEMKALNFELHWIEHSPTKIMVVYKKS